jgi:hypothetical protein
VTSSTSRGCTNPGKRLDAYVRAVEELVRVHDPLRLRIEAQPQQKTELLCRVTEALAQYQSFAMEPVEGGEHDGHRSEQR